MSNYSKTAVKKTFPIELTDALHKSLKHKAIESDKTLHTFIVDVLESSVRENSPPYGLPTMSKNKKGR
jgi:hypothetical protein